LLSDKLLLAYKIKSKEYLIMEHKMFCYQCQETAGCSGCTQMGVCGKKPEVAAMQDLLVYVSKGLSAVICEVSL
jgi:hydroxylamine reductase